MNYTPKLTVIIPSHNRVERLLKNLEGFTKQSVNEDLYEVVVIADNCSDDTAARLKTLMQVSSLNLRVFEKDFKSAAACRNFGATRANAKQLLFLDDDIYPGKNLLDEHIKSFESNSILIGYSKPVFTKKPTLWQRRARRWWEDRFFEMSQPDHRFSYMDYFSGNVSMPLDLFKSVGGYNTILGRHDYEFGIRLMKTNVKFRFSGKAIGYHYEENYLANWLRRLRQDAKSHIFMSNNYPDLWCSLFQKNRFDSKSLNRIDNVIRKVAFQQNIPWRFIEKTILICISILENLNFRGLWIKLVGVLAEYNYWSGIVEIMKTEKAFLDWQFEMEQKNSDKKFVSLELTGILGQENNIPLNEGNIFIKNKNVEIPLIENSYYSEPLTKTKLQSILFKEAAQNKFPLLFSGFEFNL